MGTATHQGKREQADEGRRTAYGEVASSWHRSFLRRRAIPESPRPSFKQWEAPSHPSRRPRGSRE
ncbi:Hypothetical protein AA314_06371 [Archangium gephyra]|uniref:Uncharacterized protein n=1 Tax=Archangium gephyra TaxID=48 RepID=A0AAC8QCC0_9BACT|nr:Hypothetical protein AA314_06371 [Archangium gephyra]